MKITLLIFFASKFKNLRQKVIFKRQVRETLKKKNKRLRFKNKIDV